jgi:hypothetical protein
MKNDCSNCFWGDNRLDNVSTHCDYTEEDEFGICDGWDYEQNTEKQIKAK